MPNMSLSMTFLKVVYSSGSRNFGLQFGIFWQYIFSLTFQSQIGNNHRNWHYLFLL